MMFEIDIDFEQNSFDQEHSSLCLEWEDTVTKNNHDSCSVCIVKCIPQQQQYFRLDLELYTLV